MAIITTNKGEEIVVDDEDIDILNKYTWHLDKDGYARTSMKINGTKKMIQMHRFIMGNPTGMTVDHKNSIRTDNRKENLRVCTRNNNNKNINKTKGDKTSVYKGVFKGKCEHQWRSSIRYNGNYFDIGVFSNEIACANAYNYYAKQLHGEFAGLNDAPFMEKDEWEKYKLLPKSANNKGVSKHSQYNKWIARILNKQTGKREYLGIFETEDEAVEVYKKREKELLGSVG